MANKILLVEDEALIALDESRTIEKNGYEVETLYNGEKAVEKVYSDTEVSLVLMDIDLGKGMDGTEAAEKILEHRTLPIVFLTSHSEKEYVDRVKKITRYGYVLKNSGKFVLLEAINMAFELFEAHEQLRKKEIEARAVVDNIDSAVVRLDTRGRVIFFSKGAEHIFGYSADEVMGRSELDMIVPPVDSYGNDLERMYEKLIQHPEKYRYHENENICKDGTRLWMAWRNTAVHDDVGRSLYIQSIGTDITERKRMEESLRESEERFRVVYENMAVGVARVSLDFRIEAANAAYCTMLGYTEAELKGTHLKEITHPEVVEENLRKQTKLARGEIDHYRMEKKFIHKKGHTIYGLLDANLVRDGEGSPHYFIGSIISK